MDINQRRKSLHKVQPLDPKASRSRRSALLGK